MTDRYYARPGGPKPTHNYVFGGLPEMPWRKRKPWYRRLWRWLCARLRGDK